MERSEGWACGGGTQSVTIGALIVRGLLPKPDIAWIVDTGREKRSTWDYYDAVLKPNLAAVGVDLIRVPKIRYATVDIWSTNGETLELPAFSTQVEGGVGKLSNYCSHEWKRRVADRFLRERGLTKTRRWLGFSLDEPRRWLPHEDKSDVWLPLVFGHPMRRDQCVSYVLGMGWPKPPRSACWMCPNMTDEEWKEIRRNRPDEFAKAVYLEREVRQRDPHAFFHPSCVPLDQVDWTRNHTAHERACDSGHCFV